MSDLNGNRISILSPLLALFELTLALTNGSLLAVGEASRFGFGANWQRFNESVTDTQRAAACASLEQRLGDIHRLSFLDIGAGSGLFSDAARALGANVTSFDFDPARPDIERGDILDDEFMRRLGRFDIVYAWGVLHHTGDMWRAIANACDVVAPGGRLFMSIYNDQGNRSRRWRTIKRRYGRVPQSLRPLYVLASVAPSELTAAVRLTLRGRNYFARLARKDDRGMRVWRDMVDWVGGYPFEVARPEEVFAFVRARGFELEHLRTAGGGHGCNEFVFRHHMSP